MRFLPCLKKEKCENILLNHLYFCSPFIISQTSDHPSVLLQPRLRAQSPLAADPRLVRVASRARPRRHPLRLPLPPMRVRPCPPLPLPLRLALPLASAAPCRWSCRPALAAVLTLRLQRRRRSRRRRRRHVWGGQRDGTENHGPNNASRNISKSSCIFQKHTRQTFCGSTKTLLTMLARTTRKKQWSQPTPIFRPSPLPPISLSASDRSHRRPRTVSGHRSRRVARALAHDHGHAR